jgi:hypothetical protein
MPYKASTCQRAAQRAGSDTEEAKRTIKEAFRPLKNQALPLSQTANRAVSLPTRPNVWFIFKEVF